ncbi:hypothetical protein [Pyrobaculum aerophilum]|uniref:Uncharacterized protein n=2 Tax=Pyrobaculum aerophilum TaxID=13773 RepID=Q8ZXX2_PYRAE|nr:MULTISPECIES: hypothetical protein [Pyrobaculum]AAL63224.1 hypothetical protein PAE1046 [Pyrobaculum aerophilum str. IM2]MCX8137994.1 hypothetical protein [Pyrobaculum aerophilum]HII48018.1 hypothetical protein [Pyrobaculum aerophilum]
MPIVKIHLDDRGEPIARIVEEDGLYVVSMDVFKEVGRFPEGGETLEITERYKIVVKKRELMGGVCEFVYFQFPGGTQLINVKYVGPDPPEAVIPALAEAVDEEVSPGEKNRDN